MEMMTVSFDFKGITYNALVRKKKNGLLTGYAITIMNGLLERQFFGHHFIREEDGEMIYDLMPDTEIGVLKCAITHALDRHLKQASLTETSVCLE